MSRIINAMNISFSQVLPMPLPLISRPALGLSLLITALGLAACGGGNQEPAPPPIFEYPIEVQTADPNGNPVPAVPVYLDGNVVGYTGANGKFSATLAEVPGNQVEIGVGEISGYRIAGERSTTSALRVTESIQGELRGVPISFLTTLQSVRNEYLLWVELTCDEFLDDKHCAQRPITINGKTASYTDHEGRAYFAFEGVPGEPARVAVRTPSFDQSDDDAVMIEPRSPSYTLDLSHDATIFRLRQEFTDPAARRAEAEKKKRAPRRRAVRRAPAAPSKPAAPKKPTPAEQPKRGPIELF